MNLFELQAKISVDDSSFKKSMENAQKVSKNAAAAMQQLQSPLDNAKNAFNAISHPVETAQAGFEKLKNATESIRHPIETFKNKVADASTALETKRNRLSTLASAYDSAKKKVADMTKEFNKSAKESGTSSQKTQELARKLNEVEKEAAEAKKELDNYSASVSKSGKNSDSASNGIGNFAKKLGKGLAVAGKIGVAAVGAASTAIIALGKIGFEYNKQIETYTTNFEVMMGDSKAAAKKVEELKEMGAKTPFELEDLANATQTLLAFNVSADDSTGVLSKLGDISLGNVQKLESLTRAYGKMNASQKVTLEDINMMIDAGFNPLLIVAEETGKTMTEVYDDISKGKVSFEQIEDAITKATSAGGQFYKGMEKASQTTEGLISTLKDNATALVGEIYMPISEGLTNTVLPSAINAINTLSEAFKENGINGMIASAGEMLGSLVNSIVEYAPKVVDTAVTLVSSLIQGLSDNQESIATGAIQIITSLANGILNMLPQIVQLGLDIVISLANGIAENASEIVPAVVETVMQIVGILIKNAPKLLVAAAKLVLSLAEGILQSIGSLLEPAARLVSYIIDGIVAAFGQVVETGSEIVSNVASGFMSAVGAAVTWGQDLIGNFISGVLSRWESLKSTVASVAQSVKDFLGFSEPKLGPLSNFHTYAPDMMDLFAKGIKDNESTVTDQIKKTFNFGDLITDSISFDGNGDFDFMKNDTHKYLGSNSSSLANGNSRYDVVHSGTIRVEGVNDRNELVAVTEYSIENALVALLRKQARLI